MASKLTGQRVIQWSELASKNGCCQRYKPYESVPIATAGLL